MAQTLVIVESPAKAKKIGEYLGPEYVVESSIGHVRDLPKNAADVPPAYKGEKWAKMGIDVDNDFKALYVTNPDKKGHVRHLKSLLKESDELILATDKDREGEAIAWHLMELLNPRVPVKRIVFNEVTKEAIERALENPGELNLRVVEAQEARRLLDRLYGYELSPVMWRKIAQGTSAGRVQSVATRIVVERERERMAFVSASYWDLVATFSAAGAERPFTAKILELDGARIAGGKDFADTGELKTGGRAELLHLDQTGAETLVRGVEGQDALVESREAKPYRRRPAPPFITSTYQQEAGRKLRLSSAQAMRVAQGLYERGFITYMRTDSVTLSSQAINAARNQITERYGGQFLPDEPRTYKGKSKNAQEAHEAIRPAGDTFRTPEQVASELSTQDLKVYELIWQRTVASQMTDATGETVTLRLGVDTTDSRHAVFSTSGTVIKHPGFLKAYREDVDEEDRNDEPKEQRLPPLDDGDAATVLSAEADGHDTQPPPRYTEASLVKKLEELEVGRPSTYASILATIQAREYVWKKGNALVPNFTAFAIVNILEKHFPNLVDYKFTAQLEDDLDSIAEGGEERIPYLRRFYFGDGDDPGLKVKVTERLDEIDAREINSIPIGADSNGELIEARPGKFGPYLRRGEQTASIPPELAPDELTIDKAIEILDAPQGDRELGVHPEAKQPIFVKTGRFGPYVQLGERDEETGVKPQMESLFKSMTPETITLEQAVQLLSLPRRIGVDENGQEVLARNGRYGPYVSRTLVDDDGKEKNDSRSLEIEEQLFTVTETEARELFAQPKRRRGQAAPKAGTPVGVDPATDKPVELKDGRFGPYVTDGETNASLRKGDDPETITIERASELLAIRREAGPVKKRKKAAKKKKKASTKKATKKKTSAKKKAPAKKSAAAKRSAAAQAVAEDPF
ncbi:MAG: type I DNA topoisomerase [Acidimicrobiia bacterium]|nr:type I DNA topoisomerase [Acidimicrobiia bacterium]